MCQGAKILFQVSLTLRSFQVSSLINDNLNVNDKLFGSLRSKLFKILFKSY